MPLRDLLLPELELEASFTRKHLERVPMTLGFKPHSKSMTLGELATFIAVIPTWGQFAPTTGPPDVAPGGDPVPEQEGARSHEALPAMVNRNRLAQRCAHT